MLKNDYCAIFLQKSYYKINNNLLIVRFYQVPITHKNTMRFYVHSISC